MMILINKLPVQADQQCEFQDFLELEWYEINAKQLKRHTVLGLEIQLQFDEKTMLQDGQLLYRDPERSVRVKIRPCLCVVLKSASFRTIGLFCYDVGNMHLPIFQIDEGRLAVSYDGRLFEALRTKYEGVSLAEMKLLPERALKPFGNFT